MERPSSPEQNLWSSILDSVSSSRAIPSRNVIILGEPNSGKSTLSNALLQKSNQQSRGRTEEDSKSKSSKEFAIGYEWANVKDEAEEGEILVVDDAQSSSKLTILSLSW